MSNNKPSHINSNKPAYTASFSFFTMLLVIEVLKPYFLKGSVIAKCILNP
jgi:hypothetical protein